MDKLIIAIGAGALGIGIGVLIGKSMAAAVPSLEKVDVNSLIDKIKDAKIKADLEVKRREQQKAELEKSLFGAPILAGTNSTPRTLPSVTADQKKEKERLLDKLRREIAEWKAKRSKHAEDEGKMAPGTSVGFNGGAQWTC